MTFIPKPDFLKPGDKVKLAVDVELSKGTYTKGHLFTIKESINGGQNFLVSDGTNTEVLSKSVFEKDHSGPSMLLG
jgi:hypothetical protein